MGDERCPDNGLDESLFDTEAVTTILDDGIDTDGLLRAIAHATTDGFVLVDANRTILWVNETVERLFGCPAETLVGESIEVILPERASDSDGKIGESESETGEQSIRLEDTELVGRHRDGRDIPVTVSFSQFEQNGHQLSIGSIRDRTGYKERKQELAWSETIAETVGAGIYQLDFDGNFVRVNDVITEMTGYSREELLGESALLVLSNESYRKNEQVIRNLMATDERVSTVELTAETASEEEIPVENRMALLRSNGELQGSVGVIRDVSARKRRERELQEQRNELVELNRINAVIRDTIQALVSASSRSEIENTICELFTESEPYIAASIFEERVESGEVVPTAVTGIDEYLIKNQRSKTDETADHPVESVYERTDVHVTQTPPNGDQIRGAHDVTGELTLATVPIVSGETTTSVLQIYTDRPGGFDVRELSILKELGETIGLVLNALKTQKLLYGDTVVELKFKISDADLFFSDVSRELGCTFRLDGVVSESDGELLPYVSLLGAPAEQVVELAREHPDIGAVSLISEGPDEALLTMDVQVRTPATAVMEAGASIKHAVVEDGDVTLVTEVSPDTDTRSIVDTLKRQYPGATLFAQREVERPVQTSHEFRRALLERLTSKQHAVLEAAYVGGYFERPRSISGKELAAALDITSSTFHQHLQAGLRKVVATVFETPDDN